MMSPTISILSKALLLTCLCAGLNFYFGNAMAQTEPKICAIKSTPTRHFSSKAAVLAHVGPRVRNKLAQMFASQAVDYPPTEMTWICLKAERKLLLFARDKNKNYKLALQYPIIGASGNAGPKLKEGDMQVPEGFYRLSGFRPNLVAYMGLDVSYPNSEDKMHAREAHRTGLGSDILIHGSRWSTGCLAMGNEPIEEMFVLANDVGLNNIKLIFAPCDLTTTKPDIKMDEQPKWLPVLYSRLKKSMSVVIHPSTDSEP